MTTDVSFTAKDVMALRQKTGLGMMDCKKALTESAGDMAAAEAWLRQTLKGKMAQRTERATAEGRIGIVVNGGRAAVVEIRTETDFTARNDDFVKLVADVAHHVLGLPAGPVQPDADLHRRRRRDGADGHRCRKGQTPRGDQTEAAAFGKKMSPSAAASQRFRREVQGIQNRDVLRRNRQTLA